MSASANFGSSSPDLENRKATAVKKIDALFQSTTLEKPTRSKKLDAIAEYIEHLVNYLREVSTEAELDVYNALNHLQELNRSQSKDALISALKDLGKKGMYWQETKYLLCVIIINVLGTLYSEKLNTLDIP